MWGGHWDLTWVLNCTYFSDKIDKSENDDDKLKIVNVTIRKHLLWY